MAASDPHAVAHQVLAALRTGRPATPADAVADHMAGCTDATAALVVDGSADDVIARLVDAGWTLHERTDHIAGKRIRFVSPPPQEEDSRG